MCVLEVSAFRSRTPRALWCAVTVHSGHPLGTAASRTPSAAPDTPDGWLFASGRAAGGTAPGACAPGAAGPALRRGDPVPVCRMARQLVSHARREAATTSRWYLLADAEEEHSPDVVPALHSLGAALAEYPSHRLAAEAVAARAPLTVLYSGFTHGTCRTGDASAERPDYREVLLDRIGQLARQGLRAREITCRLALEGFTLAPGRDDSIGVATVQRMLREDVRRTSPVPTRRRPRPVPGEAPGPDEWWLPDLAVELSMPVSTLYSWVRRGWVTAARKETRPPYRWIVRAGSADLGALHGRRVRTAGAARGGTPGPDGAAA